MKRLTLLLSLLLLASVVCVAQQPASAPPSQPTGQAAEKAKTHKVTAEVLSVDAAASTITVKNAEGKEMTAKVEGKAAESLSSFAAGDKVMLVCRDGANGEHQAVVAIQKAKAPAAKPSA